MGDDVYGVFGVQEHAVSDGGGVIKIDTSLAAPSTYLGALGMTGLTAYFGLLDTGKLKPGEAWSSPARPGRWAASPGRSRS